MDTPATGTIDWDAALGSALGDGSSTPAPVSHTPSSFADTYGSLADKVSAKTGIDSNTILGQWGLETGWGKSVIPGTNNLGNVKSTAASGPGVSAMDNQTGTTDQYQAFNTPDDFADHYTNLLNNRYKGALNTGADPLATASALKAGGYAQDPNYVSKLVAAAKQVSNARGGTNWDSLLGGGQAQPPAQPAAQPTPQSQTPDTRPIVSASQPDFTPMGAATQQPAAPAQPDVNPLSAAWAGAKESALNKVYGLQKLAGQGMQYIDPANAPAVMNDADQNLQRVAQESEAAGGHTTAGKIGGFAADVVPYIVAPEAALAQAGVGALSGAAQAAATGGNVVGQGLLGGALGAAGPIVGHAIGGALGAAGSGAAKGAGAITGGIGKSADDIALQAIKDSVTAGGQTVDDAANSLRAGVQSAAPGTAPSAAEAASDIPGLAAMQDAASKTDAGANVFTKGDQANTDTLVNNLESMKDPNAGTGPGSDSQVFNQIQEGLQNQAQNELPPLDAGVSDGLQGSSFFNKSLKSASDEASNTFPADANPFTQATEAAHADLATQIENRIGTPEILNAAKDARSAQATIDYGKETGYMPATDAALQDLGKRPEFISAFNDAATADANRAGQAGLQVQPPTRPGISTGPLAQRTPGQVSLRTMQGAKAIMEDSLSKAMRANDWKGADEIAKVKAALTQVLNDNSKSFTQANANYAAASGPISRMQALQDRLYNVQHPSTGEVLPSRLDAAINSIKKDQLKGYITKADSVTPDDMNALADFAAKARGAGTSIAGLNPEGQLLVLKHLQAGAAKTLVGSPERALADQYASHLASQSPALAAHLSAAATTAPQIAKLQAQQVALKDATDKISNLGSNLNASNAARALNGLVNGGEHAHGPVGDVASQFLASLQNKAAVDAGGLKASIPTYGGMLGSLMGHGGSTAAIAMSALHNPLHAAAAFLGQRILGKGQAAVEDSMVNWLKHGNAGKLADALQAAPTSAGGSPSPLLQAVGRGTAAAGNAAGNAAVLNR